MKNSYLLIACLLLLTHQQTRAERIDTLLHFSYADLKVDTLTAPDGNTYTKLTYPGCVEEEEAGVPSLPVKYVHFTLPENAEDISVSIRTRNVTTYGLSSSLCPIQPAIPYLFPKVEDTFLSGDSSIYTSDNIYPATRVNIHKNALSKKGDRKVTVAMYPAVYQPVQGYFEFCEDMSLSLTYTIGSSIDSQTKNVMTTLSGLPYYEYCVITSSALKDSFTRLIAWQRQKGLNAGVVCIEDILSNSVLGQNQNEYGYLVPGPYTLSDKGKLRQYLREAVVTEEITKYVLLGGDYTIIPTRYARRVDSIWGAYSDDLIIPSDWYYSELSSSWYWTLYTPIGDLNDEADVAVGRILCTIPEDVENFTNKLLRYEMNPGNGNNAYLKKAFYLQADDGQASHDANRVANIDSTVFTTRTILQELPSYDATNPTYPTGNQAISAMNARYGYASFYSHGNPYIIQTMTSGNNDPFNQQTNAITSLQGIDTLAAMGIVSETANGMDKLSNKYYPMFIYSTSCTNMPFDNPNVYNFFVDVPNLGKSLTTGGDYGCAAFVGNTRLGIVQWSSILQGKFNLQLPDYPIGTALNNAKRWYNNVDSCRLKQYLMLTTNLIGSPNMNLWTNQPSSYNVTYDVDGYLTFNEPATSTSVLVHNISPENNEEELETYQFSNVSGEQSAPTADKYLITVLGENYLPKILPLYIWCPELHGKHYFFTKDVICERNDVNVVFETDADYTFETSGTFRIGKGVTIKKGARVKILPSKISY